jgi:succinate-acetate transporter protein
MVVAESREVVSATTPVTAQIADPSSLGMAGFAGAGLVLSLVNSGALDGSALIATVLPFALFLGGLVELVAGVAEFRRGSSFGATTFCVYAGFWLSFGFYARFFSAHASAAATAVFILVFAIITAYISLAAARVNAVVFAVFSVWTLSFVVLTVASFASSVPVQHVGGWLGVLSSVIAFYASAAALVNDTWRRPVLPTLPMLPR